MATYALSNNKGGVGKSYLTFQIACEYARTHPAENVLVIDVCPQAKVQRDARAAHRVAPGLHVVVVWPDQLHALLNWLSRDVDWLAETLSRARRVDGPELDTQLKYGMSGPMWRAFTETIRRVGVADTELDEAA